MAARTEARRLPPAIVKDGRQVRLYSRNGHEWTTRLATSTTTEIAAPVPKKADPVPVAPPKRTVEAAPPAQPAPAPKAAPAPAPKATPADALTDKPEIRFRG